MRGYKKLSSFAAVSIIGFLSIYFVSTFRLLAVSNADGSISVYFNHSEDRSYKDPYRHFVRKGDNLEAILLHEILKAKDSIEVAVQELRLPTVSRALIRKAQEGVRVRVILENQYDKTIPQELKELQNDPKKKFALNRIRDYITLIDRNHDSYLEADELAHWDAIYMLRQNQVPLKDDTADGSKGSGLMHHKFVVIDGHELVVTSANFTLSDVHGDLSKPDSRGNENAMLVIHSAQLANYFEQEFNIMWGRDGAYGRIPSRFGVNKPYRGYHRVDFANGSQVVVQFSPTSRRKPWALSSSGLIAKILSMANSSIQAALFGFSDQKIVDEMHQLYEQKDIRIEALVEREFAFRSYSELLDMLGLRMLDATCKYEANNHPWPDPIQSVGTVHLEKGDLLHHKYAVVDGKIVIFGSHNWTDSANYQNDETLTVIADPIIAKAFVQEFQRLRKHASWGAPSYVLQQIQQKEMDCQDRIDRPTP